MPVCWRNARYVLPSGCPDLSALGGGAGVPDIGRVRWWSQAGEFMKRAMNKNGQTNAQE